MSDTASAIAAQGEARKEQVEESYRNQNRAINNELGNMESERAQNIANTGAQAISAIGTMANAIDSKPQKQAKVNAKVNDPSITPAEMQTWQRTKDLSEVLANQQSNEYLKRINGTTL